MIFIKILTNAIKIKNGKKFFFFDEMIANMDNNEKLNKILSQLFVTGRKLNIFIIFITQK